MELTTNNIDKLFTQIDSNILSVYYPAGFPKLDSTMEVLTKLQNSGANMVELGIPFSDPMADGVVIQEAANQALRNGMSLKLLFEQIADMRTTITIPVILMGYINPIMKFGFENFCRKCAEVGVDGVIIPDMPFDVYETQYKEIANKYGIKVIMLITPETSDARIAKIDAATSGFIYMVSSASTTGAKNEFDPATIAYFQRIAAMKLSNKRLIGFGISNVSTFNAACNNANGAIIGSQFVKLLAQSGTIDAAITTLKSNIGI